jgi:hypothetical protein
MPIFNDSVLDQPSRFERYRGLLIFAPIFVVLLASPGGTTIEEAAALAAAVPKGKTTWHEVYSVADIRDYTSDKPAIFGFSYGEFAPSCDELVYTPYVERAEAMTRFHLLFVGGNMRSANEFKIARREWFCATQPNIAVVHIYVEV